MITQDNSKYSNRREWVFLLLAGIFLGSISLLNVLGISRFIDLSFQLGNINIPFTFAVGVIAYPITFLCTDFISEIYGKKRANTLVWVGLILNVWIIFIIWLGGKLPNTTHLLPTTGLPEFPTPENYTTSDWAFFRIRQLSFGAVTASMAAYLAAQFVDVHIFHYLKKRTKGKHLWIRNNLSTLSSQLVDSIAVILITHYFAHALPINQGEPLLNQLLIFILSTYIFKMVTAIIDTIPFYFGTKFLRKFLNVENEIA